MLFGLVLAFALRMFFIIQFPKFEGDTLIYSNIAQNWIGHGVFGLTEDGQPVPTYIRLPGYPAFLAFIFSLFGEGATLPDRFIPVMTVQLVVDIFSCLLIAGTALELLGDEIALATFFLAAMCPFTANYVALPLTETLSIFSVAGAMLYAVRGYTALIADRPGLKNWIICGLFCAYAILLRPDGGMLLAALGGFLLVQIMRRSLSPKRAVIAGLVLGLVALAPLVPWTIRNYRVFHEFQPLAPRYANAPGEFVPIGFNRWVKTWIAEYISVEEIYWRVSSDAPGEELDISRLPSRAFDSAEERVQAEQLINKHNEQKLLTPDLDARFAELASARIKRAPLRYYVWLPAMRIADMWLRPRTEMLPIDQRWWEFDDPPEAWFAVGYGALNLLFVLLGIAGAWLTRNQPLAWLLIGYVLLRSAFLGSLENPEPRYTLECFPIVLMFAGVTVSAATSRWSLKK
jgi:hypothetical protein